MGRLLCVAILVVAACGGGSDSSQSDAGIDQNGGAPLVAFIDVRIAFFGAGCTEGGCHNGDSKGGLNLVDNTWSALVNVPAATCKDGRKLVVPGKPSESYLLNKVRGTRLCSGDRMPLGCGEPNGGVCFSDERLATLEGWIRSGAPME